MFATVSCAKGFELQSTNIPVRTGVQGNEISYTKDSFLKMGFTDDNETFTQAVCHKNDVNECKQLKNWGILELRSTKNKNEEYVVDGTYFNGLSNLTISERGTGIQSVKYVSCAKVEEVEEQDGRC